MPRTRLECFWNRMRISVRQAIKSKDLASTSYYHFLLIFDQFFLVKVAIIRWACLLYEAKKTHHHNNKNLMLIFILWWISTQFFCTHYCFFFWFHLFFAKICDRFFQSNVAIKDFVKIFLGYVLCFNST